MKTAAAIRPTATAAPMAMPAMAPLLSDELEEGAGVAVGEDDAVVEVDARVDVLAEVGWGVVSGPIC